MSIQRDRYQFRIAEKGVGTDYGLSLLRWALVLVFIWFGGMKFTAYEANGIAPFIANSPIMSWLHALFRVRGASYVIGVVELSTAGALIVGAFWPLFSALGAAMSAVTYLITLTFFVSTPGVAEATAGGHCATGGRRRSVPYCRGMGSFRSWLSSGELSETSLRSAVTSGAHSCSSSMTTRRHIQTESGSRFPFRRPVIERR